MSTEFSLLKKDGVELSACESSATLSIDLYRLVTMSWKAEDCEPGDWAHLGSIEGLTKADLGILIRRLQEIYEMDTLF